MCVQPSKFLGFACDGFAVVILSLSPALAQHNSHLGTIVYERAPEGGEPWPVLDIYSMAGDGSNVKALTNDGHSHNPSWSHNGRHILFIHDSTPRTKPAYREQKGFESYHSIEVSVMNADGSNRTLLRRLEPVVYEAAWSPDGKNLAITCIPEAWANMPRAADEPMREGLFLLAADGQGELRLVRPNAFTPSWSPDGKKLAFSLDQPRGRLAIHVANTDGSHDMQLTDPNRTAGWPAWSPDGKQIAFDESVDPGREQIFVMDASGSNRRQLTSDPNWSCMRPSWSPDGMRIAMSCRSASAPCGMVSSVGTVLPACDRRIFIWKRDSSSKPTQLTEHDATDATFRPIP